MWIECCFLTVTDILPAQKSRSPEREHKQIERDSFPSPLKPQKQDEGKKNANTPILVLAVLFITFISAFNIHNVFFSESIC